MHVQIITSPQIDHVRAHPRRRLIIWCGVIPDRNIMLCDLRKLLSLSSFRGVSESTCALSALSLVEQDSAF